MIPAHIGNHPDAQHNNRWDIHRKLPSQKGKKIVPVTIPVKKRACDQTQIIPTPGEKRYPK